MTARQSSFRTGQLPTRRAVLVRTVRSVDRQEVINSCGQESQDMAVSMRRVNWNYRQLCNAITDNVNGVMQWITDARCNRAVGKATSIHELLTDSASRVSRETAAAAAVSWQRHRASARRYR